MSTQEQTLREIFAEILGLPEVEADDNFFDLGGHSLLASRLVGKIHAVLGVKVPIRRLYDAPTPATLDKFLTSLTESAETVH